MKTKLRKYVADAKLAGVKKETSFERIAKACCVSSETVRKWVLTDLVIREVYHDKLSKLMDF